MGIDEASAMDDRTIGFGRYRFDVETGELTRGSNRVQLAPLPGRALAVLLRDAGRTVSRATLIEALWQNAPPEVERSLNFAIRQIRTALGDDARRPTYIETLPRRGYRFIAPVRPGVSSMDEADTGLRPRGLSKRARLGGIAVAALAIVLMAGVGLASAMRSPEVPRIAVLPLDEIGDTDLVRFAASGLRDEVVAELTRLPADRLAVIAAGSVASIAAAPFSQGGRFGVDYLLRGAVAHRDGAASVAWQLVAVEDGRVVWASRQEGERLGDVSVEREIATRVAHALSLHFDADVSTGPKPTPRARELYLTGAYLLREGSWGRVREAISVLADALDEQPDYPPTLVAFGSALLMVGDSAGRPLIERAIVLDPSVSGAHEALAEDDLYRRWDMAGAARHFARAVAAHPGKVGPLHKRAYLASLRGRHDTAVRDIRTALDLDPVSPLVTGDVGRILYRAGRFDEAEVYCARALKLVASHRPALSCLLNLNLLQGELEAAIPFAARSMELAGATDAEVAEVFERPPEQAVEAYWRWTAEMLEETVDRSPDSLVPLAQAYVWLGEHDRALSALEEALRRGSTALPMVTGDPCFAPLFGHARYRRVFEMAGLPLVSPPNLT